MSALGLSEFLLVHGEGELGAELALAARNLPHCDMLPARGANVLSLLRHPTLLLTTAAMRELEQRLHRTMKRHSRVSQLQDTPLPQQLQLQEPQSQEGVEKKMEHAT